MAKQYDKIKDNNPDNNKGSESYSAKDIYVLEGLEPVRRRPGMYIGSTGVDGLHHLIWEVFDNSLDEAMAGFAKNIKVELLKDGKVAVTDDGRGIPVDIHPKTKKSALETAATTLHAGGKFAGESYKVSGGLHGVGLSVVNALSKWMRAEVCKDGGLYVQEYKIGKPQAAVKKIGKCDKNGTKIIFEPDGEIFSSLEFNRKTILDHLRHQAFLTKGIKIEVLDYRGKSPFYYSYYFEGGLISFVEYLNRNHNPIHKEIFYVHKNYENIEVEASFIYNDDAEVREMSFANNIYTPDGGMHLTGFRSALTRALNDHARSSNYLKDSDENLTGDDVREGLSAIVSVKLREPQFEGQTKARLGNPPARSAVETVVLEALKEYLAKYSGDSKAILEKCLLAQKARKAAKAAKDTVLRKGAFEGLTLPGKLADCSSRNAEDSELFIVEGDSAGGCFSGDTKVALADGRNLPFTDLVEEYNRGKRNYCYTIGDDGDIKIAPIEHPRRTKKNAEVLKIILDNGEEITCTPDHKFMLRGGKYKEAKDLKNDDSLMPLYRQHSKIGKRITIKGYELVFTPMSNRWIFTHLLSDKYNIQNGIYEEKENEAIHHIDFNKLNNNPGNLARMSKTGHLFLHTKSLEKTLHREDVKEKCRQIHQTKEYRDKIRRIMEAPKMKKMLSERAKKQWQNEEYKNYMAKKFLEFYDSNEEYREKNKELLRKVQREYWENIENREKQSERVRTYFKINSEKKNRLSIMAKIQWGSPELLEWRKEVTKKQWTEEFRERRRIAYNQTYLRKALEVLHDIYRKDKFISAEKYNQIRKIKNDRNLIKYETICQRFFDGNKKKLNEAVIHFNHRVKAALPLMEKIDVYDLEVAGTHNFALASGVFVHNSSKQGRDRKTQAILPLRGKILNVEKARLDKMLANNEVKSLVIALGTAISDSFDLSKLRYHKIVIMTDADVDGSHIRTLLLTLFYRYFKPIVESGHLYIAQPPLYRVQSGKEVKYAYNDSEKEKIVKEIQSKKQAKDVLRQQGKQVQGKKEAEVEENAEGEETKEVKGINIQRYKGLGEMNPDQLWETTMNPENRVLKQVAIDDAQEADRLFEILMSDQVEPRKQFIQSKATLVKNLDI